MPSHRVLRLTMLLVVLGLAAATIAGCAATERSPREAATNAFTDLRREIEAQVADPSRRAEVLSIADEFEKLLDEAVASRSETSSSAMAERTIFSSRKAAWAG